MEQILAILKMKRKDVECEFTPGFYTYFKTLFQCPSLVEGYFRTCEHIFDVVDAKEKNLLDIGCGYGLISVYLAAGGANKVVGVDLKTEKIFVLKKILEKMHPLLNNVEASLGDALKLCFESEVFDVVICHEVISHIGSLHAFLCEVNRVLKRNGIFYICDDNNSLNILQSYRRRIIWRKGEYGSTDETSVLELPIPWILVRKDMIEKKYPSIDPKTLNLLAKETAGMYEPQIFKAVEEYLARGQITHSATSKCPRDPKTGAYLEFAFNPFVLKKSLHKYGFRAKMIRPYFARGIAGNPSSIKKVYESIIAQANVVFHPISLLLSHHFEIIAQKKN